MNLNLDEIFEVYVVGKAGLSRQWEREFRLSFSGVGRSRIALSLTVQAKVQEFRMIRSLLWKEFREHIFKMLTLLAILLALVIWTEITSIIPRSAARIVGTSRIAQHICRLCGLER